MSEKNTPTLAPTCTCPPEVSRAGHYTSCPCYDVRCPACLSPRYPSLAVSASGEFTLTLSKDRYLLFMDLALQAAGLGSKEREEKIYAMLADMRMQVRAQTRVQKWKEQVQAQVQARREGQEL